MEELGHEEEGEGSEAGLDDPEQQTAAHEGFHLCMTALTWPCHLASSVLPVAKSL